MKPEALTNPLIGGHLIEASAGTGKTWTLTGILLRLLIERQMKPERIIATTFTKKAAAEMQERIRQRLLDFYDACVWCKERQTQLATLDPDQRQQKIAESTQELPALADPINSHLLLWLLDESPNRLDITLHSVRSLLANLHKLYIGTLDSFAHKLLKEHSILTANAHQRQVLTNHEQTDLITMLIKDRLRYNHAWLKDDPAYVFFDQKRLTNVGKMSDDIKNALQFFDAKMDEALYPDIAPLLALLSTIKNSDGSVFTDFVARAQNQEMGLKKSTTLYKQITQLPPLLQAIKNSDLQGLIAAATEYSALLQKLSEEEIANAFKKGFDTEMADFIALGDGLAHKLYQLGALCHGLFDKASNWLLYDVANYVRQTLPALLSEQNTTTHTLKMHELLKVLRGQQGKRLARHIFYQYPIALIDEVQDVSGAQADLIEAIYLNHAHLNHLKDKGFLLLVGDPKQAIYRFRGGDVANYNRLRARMDRLGLATDATLTVNRRSDQRLIDALNDWFFGAYGQMGEGISYQHISATKDGQGLMAGGEQAPITLLKYERGDDPRQAVANHIHALLHSGATLDDGTQKRPLLASDIAVLVNNNDDIPVLAGALKALGVDSSSSQAVNVFNGRAASDLYYLLSAITNPSDTHKIGVLTGLFFYDLAQAMAVLDDQLQSSQLSLYLKKLGRLWQKRGLFYALGEGFGQTMTLLGGQPFWQYWAQFDGGERYLADMWQLYELVGAWQMPNALLLEHFVIQMQTPAEHHERVNLPATQAVTLSTTHKAKGLEFNVVYALGMDKISGKVDGVISYVCQDTGLRRLSPVAEDYGEIVKAEAMAENKRLGYVALTRAAHKFYVVAKDHAKVFDSVLREWEFFADRQTTLSTPDRLACHLDEQILTAQQISPVTTKARTDDKDKNEAIDDWDDVFKQSEFIAEQHTSFTHMNKILSPEVAQGTKDDIKAGVEDDIRQRFIRGKEAGTFLHQVLQVIDGDNTRHILEKNAKKAGFDFDEITLTELGVWLDDIGRSPFLASGIALYDIEQKIAEVPFSLGLSGKFHLDEVVDLLARFGVFLPQTTNQERFFYLNGEIDLLYEHQGKYYVVDYKSNTLSDYSTKIMAEAMDKGGYWLQALIYQVALHRLLSMKFTDYHGRESDYLGAVEYVFLRGVNDGKDGGRLLWQIPLELLFAMDKLLG